MEPHLNGDQIDRLLGLVSDGMEGPPSQGESEDPRVHLRDCEVCQARLSAEKSVMERLAQLKAVATQAKSPECPPKAVWREMVAGTVDHGSMELLTHAAQCDYCGPLLHEADVELTKELGSLDSATHEWQKMLAANIHNSLISDEGKAQRRQARLFRLGDLLPYRRIAFAAFTAVAAVVCGIWLAWHLKEGRSPERLIANAYTEQRTLEVRIEGTPYAPLRQARGSFPEQNRMSRPALLKAEAEIAQQLRSYPDNVSWLQASGRASLLEDDEAGADAALAALEKAHLLAPADTSVSIDQASAYILRGQFRNRVDDFGKAIEILGKVVSSQPTNEVAKFNYALALEKHHFKQDAQNAWLAYIQQFPKSAWMSEAHDHLSRLQQDLRSQKKRSDSPLKSTDQLAAAFLTHDDAAIADIDGRIEEYLDSAIQTWLPRCPSTPNLDDSLNTSSELALKGIANLLLIHHTDPWLADLLEADRHSPVVCEALHLLGDSSSKVETSNVSQAEQEASAALTLFRQSRVRAGEKRAQFLLVLAEQYEHRYYPCVSAAQSLRHDRSLRKYPWILIQADLEAGICAGVSDRQAFEEAKSAFDLAKAHRYPNLVMRATSIESGLYSALGDTHRAWVTAAEALTMFWAGSFPRLRGYNSLIVMDEINLPLDQWFLQAAILEEAMPLVDNDPRTDMVAIGYTHLGQAFMETGDFNRAEKSYRQAELLFNRSSPGNEHAALNAEAELGFAKVDLARNRVVESVDRLYRIRPAITRIPDDPLLLDYYQTSGTAQLRAHHLNQAESDLESAVQLTENGLRELNTEDDRWKWSHENEPLYRTLVQVKLQNDPKQALLDWEWYKGAALRAGAATHGFSSSEYLPSSRDKAFVFPVVPDDSVLVSFVLLPGGYAVWVWDQAGIREKWVDLDEQELVFQVMRFDEHCADPHSSATALHKEGGMLYEKLFLPIVPWIFGRHHLVVELDGVLKALPIGLLEDSTGKYLGDRFAISISPGVVYLNDAREWKGITRASDALIIGNAEVPGWMPLPGAEQEALTVASFFDHPHLIKEDFRAGLDSVEREMARTDVFHFSGHSQISVDSVNLVGANFGTLNTAELVAAGRGRSQLVVLSGCSTSRGSVGFFDDNDSMVQGLMGAGVPEVIASQWMIDSSSTSLLMKEFYLELLHEKPVSEALANAMRNVRTMPGYSHPYYWAGFSVFGRS